MENVRESNSGNDRRETASADSSGISITDGGNVWTNDGSESAIDGKDFRNEYESIANGNDTVGSITGNSRDKIESGYYWTADGAIERIPDGHYVQGGRLRKRRKQRNVESNTDQRSEKGIGETGEESKLVSENVLRDRPQKVKGKRGKKSNLKVEAKRLTLVSMLASASAMMFTSVALITKHKHWNLEEEEAQTLAEALNDCIATLPEKNYDTILAIIEKWTPWFTLTFVGYAITWPRIQASAKQFEKRDNPFPSNLNVENATTESNSQTVNDNDYGSIGYN